MFSLSATRWLQKISVTLSNILLICMFPHNCAHNFAVQCHALLEEVDQQVECSLVPLEQGLGLAVGFIQQPLHQLISLVVC